MTNLTPSQVDAELDKLPNHADCPNCGRSQPCGGLATLTVKGVARHAGEFECNHCEAKVTYSGQPEIVNYSWIVFANGDTMEISGL